MSHFTIFLNVHGKDCVCVHNDPITEYLYFFVIHVQFIAPKGGTLSYRLLGPFGAIRSDGDGHSVGYSGEMISYLGCAQLTPHISHFLQACERIFAARKWLGNHS